MHHVDQKTAEFLAFFFLFVLLPIAGLAAAFVAAIKQQRSLEKD